MVTRVKIKRLEELLASYDEKRLYHQRDRALLSLKIGALVGESKFIGWQELNRLLKAVGIKFYILEQEDKEEYIYSHSRKIKNPYFLKSYWLIFSYDEI